MKVIIQQRHLFVREDSRDAISFWRKFGWHQRVELVTMMDM